MNVLPTKPIEKVFIHIKGDPSVGIKAADFEAEVFIDVKCYSNEIVSTVLEDIRKQFYILYTGMAGEDVVVLFDFEVFAMNELEDKMEQEQESIPNKKRIILGFVRIVIKKVIHGLIVQYYLIR